MSNKSPYSTKPLSAPQRLKWVKMMKIHVRFWPNRFRFEKYDRKTVWGARNNPTSASEPSETLNSHISCTVYAPILGGINFQHLGFRAEGSWHRKSGYHEKELGLNFSKILYTCDLVINGQLLCPMWKAFKNNVGKPWKAWEKPGKSEEKTEKK